MRPSTRSYAWLPALIIGMTVVALIIGVITLYYIQNRLIASTGEALALAAADIADKLDRILYERYADIEVLAQTPVLRGGDLAAKSKYLVKTKEAHRYYHWLGVTDSNGRIVASSNPASVGEDRSQRDWFKDVRDRGGIHVRDAQTSQDSGGILAVAFTAPIYGPRGEFLGAVTTRVGLPVLEDVIQSTVQALEAQRGASAKIEYQFLTRDGDVVVDSIMHQEAGIEGVNLKLLALPSALLSASAKPGYIEEIHKRRQVPVVSGYASTSGYGQFTGLHWAVLVRMDRKDVLAPIQEVLWKLGIAGAVVFVPILGFLLWSTGRLRKEWVSAEEERARAVDAEFKHHMLLESTEEGIYGVDLEGRCTFINKAGARMLSYAPEEVLGRNMHQLMHHTRPDGSPYPVTACPLFRAFKTGKAYQVDDEIVWRKDGTSFAATFTSSPLLEDGTVKGAVVTFLDITVRKQTERALQESETRTRLIVNTALDAVIVMDSQGLIKDWNQQAEKIFGWSRAEALGRLLSETIIPPQHRDAHNRGLKRFLATGDGPVLNKRIEITALHRQGHEFPVELSISPLRSGETLTFSAFVRDITERKRAEADLQAAKENAEAANRAKSEFLASMSHEIRTPMNAIVGMADLLAETALSADQRKYVQIFRRAGDNLLSLINDILDLSKVEASQLELERTGFDLNELMEKVTEMLAVRAHEKFLELACHIAPEVPPYLVGDPTRLRQVLVNLLGNAIKFTDSGEVVLRVEQEKDAPPPSPSPSMGEDKGGGESVALRFAISDTGVGIPPDKLGMIFERFTQVDSSTTRKHGGTGLGLAICKRLVELMGGRIWAKSSPGLCTTFYFTVCFEVQPATQRSRKFTPVQLQGLRTLVVDDNDTNRLILRELLSSWKAVVTEAETGTAALAELQRAQAAGAPYELLLLDCRMPEMDGFQVAEAIRAHTGLTGVTMMMLTSDNRKDHIQRSRDLGLAGYVVKPIRRTDLLEAVAMAVGQNRSAVSPAPAEVPPTPATAEDQRVLRILLAEDSSDNRLLIQSYFKKTLHHLDIADNGAIAVAKFRARNYDLVLMDMQMPVKDGYAATRAIRQWERDHGRPPTPIIALTAHALKGDEEKTLAAGCTAHLAKPIKKAVLLQVIQEHARVQCSVAKQS
jgi:PAS domain S-box-containing protein